MNKDPAFLFYSSDFLVGTMLMSDEQVGKYVRILALMHTKGGYLTKNEFNKICVDDETEIISKFKVDDEGIYYNERLLSEMRKRKEYTESRRNNLKGNKKTNDMETHMDNHMGTHMEEHMNTHMENENINININDLSLKNNKKKKIKTNKNIYGAYKNIQLSEDEYNKLIKDFPNVNLTDLIEWFSAYVEEKDYKSKSHNLAIRRWVIEAFTKDKPKQKRVGRVEQETNYNQPISNPIGMEEELSLIEALKNIK